MYDEKLIIVFCGKIWTININNTLVYPNPIKLPVKSVMNICATDHGVYFGEYSDNKYRHPVDIYYSQDGYLWSSIYKIQEIQHIHGIYWDEFERSIYITTGDSDSECHIINTKDRFNSVNYIIGGSQEYRIIIMVFTKEYIYFGTDTPLEYNYIKRMKRANYSIEQSHAVNGSIFSGCKINDWIVFSSAVEPSLVNKSKKSIIYASRDGEKWIELAKYQKDFYNLKLFQYGVINLMGLSDYLIYSTVALRNNKNISFIKLD